MLGSSILEVTIGLVLVYLLLSLICSAMQESIEVWLKKRASNLESGLRELLHDPKGTGLVRELYKHPLIYGLFRGDYEPAKTRNWLPTKLPSYLPAASFATALMDIIVRGAVPRDDAQHTPPPAGEISVDSLRAAAINSTTLNVSVQRIILLMLDSAHGDLSKAQANLEAWFNRSMDRVSGWYKRQTQWILLGIGLVVAISLNVDSLRIANELYRNDALRAGAIAQAGAVAKEGTMAPELSKSAMDKLGTLNLPIGWSRDGSDPISNEQIRTRIGVIYQIIGWILTAIAISFGAPFWFDLLNKLTFIRSAVKPQAKTPVAPAGIEQTAAKPDAEAKAKQAGNIGPPAVPNDLSFKPHDWASGNDPQEGVL